MLINMLKERSKQLLFQHKLQTMMIFITLSVSMLFSDSSNKIYVFVGFSFVAYIIYKDFKKLDKDFSKVTIDISVLDRTKKERKQMERNIQKLDFYGYEKTLLPIYIDEELSIQDYYKRVSKIQKYADSIAKGK